MAMALVGHRGESPEEFRGDPVIVEAFRQHGVILRCGTESDEGKWCELERGHTGEDHKDWRGGHWKSGATTDA